MTSKSPRWSRLEAVASNDSGRSTENARP